MDNLWAPEPQLVADLDEAVPAILATQKDNGQFGTEPWISTDQNVLLSLAAAWSQLLERQTAGIVEVRVGTAERDNR